MNDVNNKTENLNHVHEEQHAYTGFVHKSEDDKLRENIMRPSIEKLQLFTKMLRREALLKTAKISHT
jgi:hypothetical protein